MPVSASLHRSFHSPPAHPSVLLLHSGHEASKEGRGLLQNHCCYTTDLCSLPLTALSYISWIRVIFSKTSSSTLTISIRTQKQTEFSAEYPTRNHLPAVGTYSSMFQRPAHHFSCSHPHSLPCSGPATPPGCYKPSPYAQRSNLNPSMARQPCYLGRGMRRYR